VGVRVIEDFTEGRRTRGGEPIPDAPPPFVVTVVTRDAIDEFLGTRNARELTRHLRALRQLGLLVHEPGRLTQRVVVGRDERGYPRTRRCCVFRAESPNAVPRMRRHRAPRISFW
jgi:hypothetical protein